VAAEDFPMPQTGRRAEQQAGLQKACPSVTFTFSAIFLGYSLHTL